MPYEVKKEITNSQLNGSSVSGHYNKPNSLQLIGKVARAHRTAKQEFYQRPAYKDDVDLRAKLAEWAGFYNLSRPHKAVDGKGPYEILR